MNAGGGVQSPGFHGVLDTVQLDDGRMELQAPLIYWSLDRRSFIIPVGFRTDFDSTPLWIPGFVRVLFRAQLRNAKASTLHDFLYLTQQTDRADADALFAEALELEGESAFGSTVMWVGVRAGGWLAWRRHSRGQTRAEIALPEPPAA